MMENNAKSLSVIAVQFPISLDIEQNLQTMLSVIAKIGENVVVVFPEGALSGYASDPVFLENISQQVLENALEKLQNEVNKRRIHLLFGSCIFENKKWYNAGLYFSYNAHPFIYRKVNLATSERGHFDAGNHLSVFSIKMDKFSITAGMQLCREIRFPEQWQYLARSGAEIFFYLTNATGNDSAISVWRSHLVSRAAENQRFVISANNAQAKQMCPTMIIAPSGDALSEIISPEIKILREKIDLSKISNWYLDQARTDVVQITKGFDK